MTYGLESALRPYMTGNDNIVIVGVVLFFVLFTFVVYRGQTILAYKFQTFFSSRQIYTSDEISTNNQELIDVALLIMIGCLSISSIIYVNLINRFDQQAHYGLLMLIMLIVSMLVLIKGGLYMFINWTFFPQEKGRNWLSSFFFSIAIASVFLFPCALVQLFTSPDTINMIHCLLIIVILQKILLLCKLYVNFRPKRYSGLIFFLYFCSVEIMPTLVAWHIIEKISI